MASELSLEQREFLDVFVAECSEHLEATEHRLLQLEAAPEDKTLIREIMRSMHTIKGNSGYFGFKEMTDLSHRLEQLLIEVQEGRGTLDAAAMSELLAGVDRLKALLRILTAENADPEADAGGDVRSAADDDAADRHLLFEVGSAWFALPIDQVIEVTRPVPVARLPHVEPAIAGLINLRGTVLPQLNLAYKLWGYREEPRHLVVVHHGRSRVALAVHQVIGVAILDAVAAEAAQSGPWNTDRVVFHDGVPVTMLNLQSTLTRH